MQIFVMRHGKAEHFAAFDAERALTDEGKENSCQMAAWLAKQIDSLDMVLVSPYKRAQETWQSCAPFLPMPAKILTEEGITPYGDSERMALYLKALINIENPSSILIISHLPLVNFLCAEFDHSASSLMFSTSAICQIEFDASKDKAEIIGLQTVNKL